MLVGTILLTPNNEYVDTNSNLPKRPPQDKQLLAGLCNGRFVSIPGHNLLPPSIQATTNITSINYFTDIAITIQELNSVDLLIVSRSPESFAIQGKVFRLDKFNKIYTSEELELWVRSL